jgi:hypothetical protein
LRSTREDNLAQVEWAARADNESVLPSVRVPTLVLHRRDNRMFDIEASRAAANLIPNARFAELLGRHPTLAFHLELVELRVYAVPDSADLVVVPSIVGRTQEVTRAVVEIRNPGGAEVSVSVGLTEPPPDRTERLRSLEDFTVRATEAVGEARAAALTAIAEGWRDRVGGQVRLNKSSYSLYARAGSASVSVLTVYTTGEAVGSVSPIAKTHKLADPDQVLARYQAAGFAGAAEYPQLIFDPTIEEQRIEVQELLEWAAATIATGRQSQ